MVIAPVQLQLEPVLSFEYLVNQRVVISSTSVLLIWNKNWQLSFRKFGQILFFNMSTNVQNAL